MRALLDVNVLIAIFDTDHIYHSHAIAWCEQNLHHGWASCPITQNGCIRIMSQPSYPNGAFPILDVKNRLLTATSHFSHQFWSDNLSLSDDSIFNWNHIQGHRQLTDAYLLALAVSHSGCFVSFDKRMDFHIVNGAKLEQLVTLK
ncbi:TA system VapC family ribonuclease toxin [Acinetobacter puyangensis]|uniref:TA system VapC family ribonuclease toxin n=1 Tax=Acinetobacter puyangensis TaxID=1096779 RepID=UPI003A4DDC8F